jgi:3-hydroxyisobutyrate dehydrogenase
MVKIGFLGSGLMGAPMAQRLAASHELMVYNRTASKLTAIAGAKITDDAQEAIDHADWIFLMLSDAAAIHSILTPHFDRLAHKTIVQMGTIAPAESCELEQIVQAHRGAYLEAPVLGSIPEATNGKLLVMGGASPANWQRALPLLEKLGTANYIGSVGSAAALKLALNQMIGALTIGFAQSLSYLQAQQVDILKFMDILRASALYAPTFDKKLQRMMEQNYENPNFPAKHLAKDLHLFAASAQPLGMNLAVVESLQAVVARAIAAGWADGDYAAVLEGLMLDQGNQEQQVIQG